MLHPIGDRPPSVYWIRRVGVLVALVLVGLSVYALLHQASGGQPTAGATHSSSSGQSGSAGSSTPGAGSGSTSQTTSGAASTTASTPRSTSVAPVVCKKAQLKIAASTDATSYKVGAQPQLAIVVTNAGPSPCVAGLADAQIELRVYSGSARVWGSHDCAVAPGTSQVTLPVGEPIRRQIQWTGLSSQPGCKSVRQRVPAGNYTLYAYLSGQEGTKANFSFS